MKEDLTNKEVEIKDIADGMSFEIDTADLWANIEPQLPPLESDRRKPIWWMMTGILLGLVIAGSIFTYASSGSTEIMVVPSPALVTSLAPIQKEKIEEEVNYTEDAKSTLNNTDENNTITKLNTHTHSHLTNYDDGHSRGKMDNSNTIETNNVTTDITVIHQPDIGSISSKKTTLQKATLLLNGTPKNKTTKSQEVKNIPQIRSVIEGISYIKMINFGLLEQSISLSIPAPIIDPIKVNNWQAFWQFNTGINTSNSRISFTDNEVILDQKFEKEQTILGLSNSIQYGQENGKGWRIFGGLSHVRSATRYSNFEEVTTRTKETGVESKTIDEFGNEFETLGEITITTISQSDIVWHRAHDYVNLEVGFGKRHSIIDQLSLVTDVFVGYNLWSHHNGYYFEKDSPTITKFTSSEDHPYQNKGMDIGGKLGLEYDLGTFSIGLSSYYNHGLSNITKSNNYYQIKNSHYGVQLGVVYRP